MRLESAEDAGTTVTLWIPAVNPPADAPRKPAPAPLPVASAPRPKPKPGGKILLVEDDAMVREVIKSHLQKSHLEVLTACDGEEGLKMFRKHGPDIALVVTDITMPKMDGIALCQAVKTLDPKARVILISGDMEAMRESSLAALGPQRPMLIRKPFNFKTFVGTLQSQLDGPGNGAAE